MKKSEFLRLFEEVIENDAETLEGSELLKSLQGWDSMAAIGFIAMVDENFDVTISPGDLSNSMTVDDLCKLVGDGLED